MYKFIRPFLFKLDPEKSHHLVLELLKLSKPVLPILESFFQFKSTKLRVQKKGLIFENPIGLAAGLDKQADLVDAWYHLGFGFAEIGTITPQAQFGNPKPRIFRYENEAALVNRMGFNSIGAVQIQEKIKRSYKLPIGINLGIQKETKLENALDDYLYSMKLLEQYADYLVINISSPNTEQLRELQTKKYLLNLLTELNKKRTKPLLIKIAPDLTLKELDDICDIIEQVNIDGIVCTNTSVYKPLYIHEKGGISGKPLSGKSNAILAYIKKALADSLLFIGSGGIFTADDIKLKFDLGADLVQIYTSYIYEGPFLLRRLLKLLDQLL